jgi:hypothetical protein
MSNRKPWAWFLMGAASTIALLVAIVVIVAVVTLISDDTGDSLPVLLDDTDDSLPVLLTDFIEEAKAGSVEFVEVDGLDIEFKLIGDANETTFRTKMEKGDTIRELLRDAGIATEDFPPVKLKP